MTIGTIITITIVAIIGLGVSAFCLWGWKEESNSNYLIGAVISIIAATAICFFAAWWQLNTESGRRALKDQQSNSTGGIERTVTVYDINGKLIK